MDIRWLEDFIILSRTGNFRHSSKERNISQPAFSRRIKSLEDWVGATLVDRSTFPATLTAAGHEFQKVAEEIVQLASTSKSWLQEASREAEGTVTFACLDTLAGGYLPRLISTVASNAAPRYARVLTAFTSAEAYLDSLEEKACDFLVCYKDDYDAIQIDPDRFPSLTLDAEKIVPVAAPSALPRAEIPPNGTAERPVPLLCYTPQTYLGRIVNDHMIRRHSELVFKKVYESTIASSLMEMALLGGGLAWLPSTSIATALLDGSLKRAAPSDFDIEISIRIFRFSERRSAAAEALWSYLRNRCLQKAGSWTAPIESTTLHDGIIRSWR